MIATVKQAKPLLDLIREHEARNSYDIVWGGIRPKHRPPKRLSDMTIGEVLNWQDSIDHLYMSEAAGGYQILVDTLRGIYAGAGLTLNDKFSPDNQDLLAVYLLKQIGLSRYLRGETEPAEFANKVATVWASFPNVSGPNKGRSVYAGDGLNKALVTVAQSMWAVEAMRAIPNPNVPAMQTKPLVTFLDRLWAFLGTLKHKRGA